MTTIAYRGGVMAADSLGTRGDIRVDGSQKIQRLPNAIIAFSGNISDGLLFVDWWRRGCLRDHPPVFRPNGLRDGQGPDFHALVLTADGVSRWWEDLAPEPVLDEFFAIGSGAAAATAAMHMGASAAEAVRIAIKVDIYTGGEVICMALHPARQGEQA
jgi:ATP-dependent protease HslVU (ClpYQ) peptidase subunit